MDDDLIVVDDIEAVEIQSSPSSVANGTTATDDFYLQHSRVPKNPAEHILAASSGSRRRGTPPAHLSMDSSERTTRSATAKSKPQPKLKLKLSEKAAAQAPGMSFLGPYDRELDSDDEDLAFEEQFILRMPAGDDCERLRKMVAAREVSGDVWFKFKGKTCLIVSPRSCLTLWVDSRRAVFHIGNSTYSAKLVDLPCIIESQKTLDNKQMFKVADICQVTLPLLVCSFDD
jgi:transcription initiation factor TFIID subunit 7